MYNSKLAYILLVDDSILMFYFTSIQLTKSVIKFDGVEQAPSITPWSGLAIDATTIMLWRDAVVALHIKSSDYIAGSRLQD